MRVSIYSVKRKLKMMKTLSAVLVDFHRKINPTTYFSPKQANKRDHSLATPRA